MEHSKPFPKHTKDKRKGNIPSLGVLYPLQQGEDFDTEAWFATPQLRSDGSNNLLELSISWEGVILDIRHYKQPTRISFGSNGSADFHFPIETASELAEENELFTLIEPVKNGFLLCFYPEMDGIIEENGERLSLLDLVVDGRAHCFDRTGKCYYPLLPGAELTLKSHGQVIQLRYVSSPQFSLKWNRHIGTFAPVFSFSIITHLFMAMLAILSTSPPPKPASPPVAQISHNQPKRINSITLEPVHLCIPARPQSKQAPPKTNKPKTTKKQPTTKELLCNNPKLCPPTKLSPPCPE